MPTNCCVPLCTANVEKCKGLSYHKFPNDPHLRKLWITKIRRNIGKNFQIKAHTTVCSRHFTPDSFLNDWGNLRFRKKILNKGAIPMLFDWNSYQLPEARKDPAKKYVSPSSIILDETPDNILTLEDDADKNVLEFSSQMTVTDGFRKYVTRHSHWIKEVQQINDDESWQPGADSRICSTHFLDDIVFKDRDKIKLYHALPSKTVVSKASNSDVANETPEPIVIFPENKILSPSNANVQNFNFGYDKQEITSADATNSDVANETPEPIIIFPDHETLCPTSVQTQEIEIDLTNTTNSDVANETPEPIIIIPDHEIMCLSPVQTKNSSFCENTQEVYLSNDTTSNVANQIPKSIFPEIEIMCSSSNVEIQNSISLEETQEMAIIKDHNYFISPGKLRKNYEKLENDFNLIHEKYFNLKRRHSKLISNYNILFKKLKRKKCNI